MKHAIILCLLLCGCQSTRQFYEPVHLAKIPASLKRDCPKVADIPGRDLSARDIARIWAKDRRALSDCAARHSSLAKALTELEQQQ